MGVLKMYLGGAVLAAIGIIAIIIGVLVGLGGLVQGSEGICATGIIIFVVGIIVYFIGKFYVHVSKNTTPVIMMDNKKSRGRDFYSPPPPPPSFPPTGYAYHSGDTKEDIYEKMRTLRKMRDDGFISEEEYEEKRRELLSNL